MRYLILIGLVVLSFTGNAQQRGILSNFLLNDYYYNPAIAGSKPVHVANMSYRNQWVGFEGAPNLIMGNFYGSAKNLGKHGYGVSLISERTGITQNTAVYANYAYHIKLSESLKLGLGIQPGFMQYRVRLYDAQLADDNDEVLTGTVYSANAFDVSTGFHLYSDKFFLMGSMHHLLGNELKFTSYNSNLEYHFNGIAGFNIRFKKKNFMLQPSALVKFAHPVPLQVTGMLKGVFNDQFWLGFLYRTDDAVGVTAGLRIKERISVSYGYDYSISDLSAYQNGSQEVMLSFTITKEKPSLAEEDDELNNSILEEMKKEMEEKEKKNN